MKTGSVNTTHTNKEKNKWGLHRPVTVGERKGMIRHNEPIDEHSEDGADQ